jgi:hypothetical protein
MAIYFDSEDVINSVTEDTVDEGRIDRDKPFVPPRSPSASPCKTSPFLFPEQVEDGDMVRGVDDDMAGWW